MTLSNFAIVSGSLVQYLPTSGRVRTAILSNKNTYITIQTVHKLPKIKEPFAAICGINSNNDYPYLFAYRFFRMMSPEGSCVAFIHGIASSITQYNKKKYIVSLKNDKKASVGHVICNKSLDIPLQTPCFFTCNIYGSQWIARSKPSFYVQNVWFGAATYSMLTEVKSWTIGVHAFEVKSPQT